MTQTKEEIVAEAKAQVPSITCDDYKELRKSGENHILLDVRELDEFNEGHIEGALHIPRGLLEFKVEQAIPDKSEPIIVQCKTGGRAALCGVQLLKMGYTNVRNLEGGYTEYCNE